MNHVYTILSLLLFVVVIYTLAKVPDYVFVRIVLSILAIVIYGLVYTVVTTLRETL